MPVPLLPMAMIFSRLSTYSHRASWFTSCLFTNGIARKSKVSRLLTAGKPSSLDPSLDHAVMTVYELKLRQSEQVARVIHALGRALGCHLAVLSEEGRQPQLLEVMFQQQS